MSGRRGDAPAENRERASAFVKDLAPPFPPGALARRRARDGFMTEDTFKRHGRSLTSPAEDGAAIVPSDDAALGHVTRAIWVGGAGALRVRMLGGGVVTLGEVPAGTLLPLRATRVFSTGTTATGLVGLW
jgi:hypothetical protein